MPDTYAYCSSVDLTNRYGAVALLQVSDRNDDGVSDTGVVDSACADATELIDGYLGERYTLPLNPVPGTVLRWACAIAWWSLFVSPPPEVVAAYKDALSQLDDARAGKLILQANGVPDPAIPLTGAVVAEDGAPRIFDECSLKGY